MNKEHMLKNDKEISKVLIISAAFKRETITRNFSGWVPWLPSVIKFYRIQRVWNCKVCFLSLRSDLKIIAHVRPLSHLRSFLEAEVFVNNSCCWLNDFSCMCLRCTVCTFSVIKKFSLTANRKTVSLALRCCCLVRKLNVIAGEKCFSWLCFCKRGKS